jgi:hypothetical protein
MNALAAEEQSSSLVRVVPHRPEAVPGEGNRKVTGRICPVNTTRTGAK